MKGFIGKVSQYKAAGLLLASCGLLLLAGCAGQFAVHPDSSAAAGTAIRGMAHGGQQPISAASVHLWAVGAGSYGASATSLLSSIVTTSDGTGLANSNANAGNADNTLDRGFFTISGDYTCPTSGTLVYITVTGGDPGLGTGTNSAIKLIAPLGTCGNLLANASTTFITINEVTTVATAFALGQYFTTTFGSTSTDSFGAPSTTQAQVGLTNAFATVNNLVTINNGLPVTSSTLTNSSLTVTVTPEAAKLYTIANILASCVNSDGSGTSPCQTTLFPDVTPTGATAPTDTLQAAVYLSLNPTSTNTNGSAANLTALFGLVPGTGAAFDGSLTVQPADWTLGILYTSSGAASTVYQPQNIAVDAGGNVWIVNANSTTDNISEVSSVGLPLLVTGTSTTQQYRNIAIDTNANVFWTTASSPSETYEYSGSTPTTATSISSPYALTINGANDIFVGRNSSTVCTASTSALGAYIADSLVTANAYGFNCPTLAAYRFSYATVDANNNVWLTNAGSGGTGTTTTVFEATNIPSDAVLAVTCSGLATYPCTPGTIPATPTITWNAITGGGGVPTLATPFGIAVGQGGTNVWFANQSGPYVTEMTSATAGANFGDVTSVNKPTFLAVDGAGNIWVTNDFASSNASVSEFSSTGTVLSPTSSTTSHVGFVHAGLATPFGIAVDPSGNVWVANDVASAGTGAGLFEIVGAAAPTVTPIASALAGTINATGHGIGQKP